MMKLSLLTTVFIVWLSACGGGGSSGPNNSRGDNSRFTESSRGVRQTQGSVSFRGRVTDFSGEVRDFMSAALNRNSLGDISRINFGGGLRISNRGEVQGGSISMALFSAREEFFGLKLTRYTGSADFSDDIFFTDDSEDACVDEFLIHLKDDFGVVAFDGELRGRDLVGTVHFDNHCEFVVGQSCAGARVLGEEGKLGNFIVPYRQFFNDSQCDL